MRCLDALLLKLQKEVEVAEVALEERAEQIRSVKEIRDTGNVTLPKARVKVTNTYTPLELTSRSVLQGVNASNSTEIQPVLTSTQGDSQQPLDLRIRRDIKEMESVGVSNLVTNDQDVVYGSLGPEQDISAEDFMLAGDDNLRSSQLSRYNLRRNTNLMVQSDVESPLKQLRKRAEIRVDAKNEESPSKKMRSLSLEGVVEGHSVSTGKHTSAEDHEQMLMMTFQNRMMRSTERKDRDGDEPNFGSEIESRRRSLPRLFESPADQSVHSCQLSETEEELRNKVVESDVPVNRSMDRIQCWKEEGMYAARRTRSRSSSSCSTSRRRRASGDSKTTQ